MLTDLLLIIVGVALVLWGADRLTEGAAQMARRFNVSEMVIGLTVVAAGTSAPELFVSVVSALKGTPDLAVGNVVGSNIMNTLLIVGVSAMAAPLAISSLTVEKDLPLAVVASSVFTMLCLCSKFDINLEGCTIGRVSGVVLLTMFAAFMYFTLKMGDYYIATDTKAAARVPVFRSVLWIVVGLACLIVGSELFVSSASDLAMQLFVSQSVIGLTIVAGGTSLPELATSVVAARKGQADLAIGNVIGSNVFNILMVLGLTAVICPMRIMGITLIDMMVMTLSVVLLWMFSFTSSTVSRWEGAVLTAGYVAYATWLLYDLMPII